MSRVVKGKAHKFGDNVNTDLIIPATYLVMSEPRELGAHCLEGADPGFKDRVSPGDIVVAGQDFGSGSSREHAALAIKGAGVSCVIARSFARIFYRNAINVGLPLLESASAVDGIADGDTLRIDLGKGLIEDLTQDVSYKAESYPAFMQDIIDAGGLIDYLKNKESRSER